MRRALLDVNVLLALLDTEHVHHARSYDWLDDNADGGWASCPITENGFVRVISQPRYLHPVSASVAIDALAAAERDGDHEHWACDVSLTDPSIVDRSRLHGPLQITDAYLLALAVAHGGRFATFDRSVALTAVAGATEDHLAVI